MTELSKTRKPKPGPAWKTPWLVQRLDPPFEGARAANPFSFGGGLKDGGLKPEAIELLTPYLRFDYMGAAEYEFGDVPKAFMKIIEHAQSDALESDIIEVNATEIFLMGHEDHMARIEEFVIGLTNVDARKRPAIRDWSNIDRVVHPEVHGTSRYQPTTCGWLELYNGFMFFTDRTMFEGVFTLFTEQPQEGD